MKNMKLIGSIVLSLGLVFAAREAKVGLQKSDDLASSASVNLVVTSDVDVHGLQFEMSFNADEIAFVGIEGANGDFVKAEEVEAGLIRGLAFRMDGESITKDLKINFEPVADFDGTSTVNFEDVIVADGSGQEVPSTFSSIDISFGLPTETTLKNSYPNPFNPTTAIPYELATESNVNITIYDATGREVDSLVNGMQTAGAYSITWDASNHASGMYFVKMAADNQVHTQKLMLVK